MSFVALDLGASGTRFVSNEFKVQTIPNNAAILMEDEEIRLDVAPGTELVNCLEVRIKKTSGEMGIIPSHGLIGSITERYGSSAYPLADTKKTDQPISYLSSITAIAMCKLQYDLDNDINVYMALPPSEVKYLGMKPNNTLLGSYEVTFPKFDGGVTVKFNVVGTKIYEESYMAAMSYFFDVKGQRSEKGKELWAGTVLSLDIGASTTDVAVVKNGVFLETTGRTFKAGGNIARDYLIDYVNGEYQYNLPYDEAEKAIAEGRLKWGAGKVDIAETVEKAKQSVAKAIVKWLKGYFPQINMPIQNFDAIIVSGGGSMQGQYINDGEVIVTSKPMSYYITEELIKICNTVAVNNHSDYPRFANIQGLYIKAHGDALIARYMADKKKVKAETKEQAAPVAPAPVAPVKAETAPVETVAPATPVETAPSETTVQPE